MSKPRDPVLAVLAYFETADLPLARQALALIQATLRRRGAAPVRGNGTVRMPAPRPPMTPPQSRPAPTPKAAASSRTRTRHAPSRDASEAVGETTDTLS
jgi:hypothetical protein